MGSEGLLPARMDSGKQSSQANLIGYWINKARALTRCLDGVNLTSGIMENRRLKRVWIGVVLLVILVGSLVVVPSWSPSSKVVVSIGADGQAHLMGIPLGHGNFRKIVFSMLFRLRKPGTVVLAPGRYGNFSNVVEISQAMRKAGWTNAPRENPYE